MKTVITCLGALLLAAATAGAADVPVLLYHRVAGTKNDSMTITRQTVVSQFEFLKNNGYRVVPLSRLEEMVAGRQELPAKTVAICTDDGHMSNLTELLPLARRYRFPVTLFVYPSAIGNASYALTWHQLKSLAADPLVEIQSHTYWHPNFKSEKKRMGAEEYRRFVDTQLARSKARLEKELGRKVTALAWPFGIHDTDLVRAAGRAGYTSTYTIEARGARRGDDLMRLPRYLLTEADKGGRFEALVKK